MTIRPPGRGVVVADRPAAGAAAPLAEVVAAAAAGGARWVLLREKDLPRDRATRPGRGSCATCWRRSAAGSSSPGRIRWAVTRSTWPPTGRARTVDDGLLVGRSCHDAADLARLTGGGLRHRVAGLPQRLQARVRPGPGSRRAGAAVSASPTGRCWPSAGSRPAAGRGVPGRRCAGVAVMGAVMRAADPAADRSGDDSAAAARASGGRGGWRDDSAGRADDRRLGFRRWGRHPGRLEDVRRAAACYGTSVITAVTAQNTVAVHDVHASAGFGGRSQLDGGRSPTCRWPRPRAACSPPPTRPTRSLRRPAPGSCPIWWSTRCWSRPPESGSAWTRRSSALLPYAAGGHPQRRGGLGPAGPAGRDRGRDGRGGGTLAARGRACVVVTGGDLRRRTR